MRKVIFILMLFVFHFGKSETLTLEQCQQLAQDNYPLLKQYEIIDKCANFDLSNAVKGYLPSINIGAQATWQNSIMSYPEELTQMFSKLGVDMKGLSKDQYKVAVEVNQVIWDGGAIANQKDYINASKEVNTKSNNVEMYSIRDRVNSIYFGVLLVQRQLEQNQKLLEVIESNCKKVSAYINNGAALKSDLSVLEAEQLTAQQNRTALIASEKAYRQMLGIFVNKNLKDVELLTPITISADNLANSRPELSVFAAKKRLLDVQMENVNTSLMPKIGAFAQGYYGNPGYNVFEDMLRYKWSFNFMVGIKVNWNLSSLYNRKNNIDKIIQNNISINVQKENFLFNNNLQATQKRNEIEKIKQIMTDDNKIIGLRESIRVSSEAKFSNGVIDINDLLQDIIKEDQSKITRNYHEIELLKNIYDYKFLLNN